MSCPWFLCMDGGGFDRLEWVGVGAPSAKAVWSWMMALSAAAVAAPVARCAAWLMAFVNQVIY